MMNKIRVPMKRRSVVMPSAPTIGNRLLANEAPLWIDTMAMINRQIGSSAEGALPEVGNDILNGPFMRRSSALRKRSKRGCEQCK